VKLKLQSSSVDFVKLADRNQKTRDTQRKEADELCVVELTIVVLCDSNDKKRGRRLEIDRRSAKMAREQVNVDHEEMSLIRDRRRCLTELERVLVQEGEQQDNEVRDLELLRHTERTGKRVRR
jgi:hypothetical protein